MDNATRENLQVLAARRLGKQAQKLRKRLNRVQDRENIEHVHKARVTSRRLRVALKTFKKALPGKKAKHWRKEIKPVTKGLGKARDKDVLIANLDKLLETVTGVERDGMRRFRLRMSQERDEAQGAVEKAASRFKAGELLDFADDMQADKERVAKARHSAGVLGFVYEQLTERVEGVQACREGLEEMEDTEEQHQLRIAYKRLRYTLEIFRKCYDGRLDATLKDVKRMQDLLGDMHDRWVWLGELERFAVEERERTEEYFGCEEPFGALQAGIDRLRAHWRSEAGRLFEEARGCEVEMREHRTLESMLGLAQQAAVEAEHRDKGEEQDEGTTKEDEESTEATEQDEAMDQPSLLHLKTREIHG